MIKYLIHFRSLTLICLYLGGRGGDGGGEGGGERGGAPRSGFHLSVFIMETVLSSPSIRQNAEKETEATNKVFQEEMYAAPFAAAFPV